LQSLVREWSWYKLQELKTRDPKRIKKVIGYQYTTNLTTCGRTARHGGVAAELDLPQDDVAVEATRAATDTPCDTTGSIRDIASVTTTTTPLVTVDEDGEPPRPGIVNDVIRNVARGPQRGARAPGDVSETFETRVGVEACCEGRTAGTRRVRCPRRGGGVRSRPHRWT